MARRRAVKSEEARVEQVSLGEDAPRELLEAAGRSRSYAVYATLLEYPDGAVLERLKDGELQDLLRQVLSGHPDSGLAERTDWKGLADLPEGDDDLAVEFTRLFDVGSGGSPPCPLYAGAYGGDRMKSMEEAVRFYDFFELKLSEKQRELPDHLSIQLEFLHFLSFREAEALQAGTDPDQYRRAQRDFLSRNPGKWVPQLKERLEKQNAPPFYRALFDGLASFLGAEAAHLGGLLSSSRA